MNKSDILLNGMISKGANVRELTLTEKELEKINSLTLEPLKAEDVYVFRVAMCDNEIDRQYEKFSLKALKDMAGLFIGKPLIKDHDRKADNQIGRIYDTEVVASDTDVTEHGEAYTTVVAHCYILNTDSNKDLITEIKGGIKKEVSVNMRVEKAVCSICKIDNAKEACPHWWGREYDGEKCHFTLDGANDAFELSFVAVPAQAKAGTMKQHGAKDKATPSDKEKQSDPSESDKSLELKIKALDAYIYIQNQKTKEEE